ncbi:hypothetical protein [Candidatus Allofournierella excrementigallinarum]|uniref:hypothetical protein n=1 Tax=Candidatus Allofournierella excrementigallinarum TaxID=2838592 RepID=UPI00374E746B
MDAQEFWSKTLDLSPAGVHPGQLDEAGRIDPAKLRPIAFDPVHNLYRALGEAAGRAFHDGLQLK